MKRDYNHKKVEKKWQNEWEKMQLYKADDTSNKSKYYILDMFPYPSGAGLHVGHIENYTATDIYSRFKRMQGFEVLHPIGWDAFGLPAENYAIKTKVPPQASTADAIKNFTRQIKSVGISYDWAREIGTHTPEYYKFTQWFFLLLYKHNLAYKQKAKVNWCPKDNTVLANEQVVNGACERCGTTVVQRNLEQWFFRITNYAEDLIAGLDRIDWPNSTKAAQRNWIGKSEGAHIDFYLDFGDDAINARTDKNGKKAHITVFTTRADTLFGATYLVLAPDHPWVTLAIDDNHVGVLKNREEVLTYVAEANKKTELERTAESKEKTGVLLEGVWAINPATNERIPMYTADYVLGTYGTGAIMAVPAHDERDYAFAKKFGLSIVQVVKPLNDEEGNASITQPGSLINSGAFDGMDSEEAQKAITEKVGGRIVTTYRLRDWLISRQRYWGVPIPVVYDPEGKPHPVPEEHLPWLLPTDVEFMPNGTSPLSQSKELLERTERIFGPGWTPEVDTMDTFVCSSWYFFRFADPHNQNEFASKAALEKWLPVDLYMGGAEHTVLHLLYARFFTKVLKELRYISFDEPFQMLRHQGIILGEDGRKMSKSIGNVINPDDIIDLYGADSMRIYEMFMGPLEVMKPWSTASIIGSRRFLERLWNMAGLLTDELPSAETERLLNQTIKKVSEDTQNLQLNTAISQMMIYTNHLASLRAVPRAAYAPLLQLVAPYAPHIAEELWEAIGNPDSIHASKWPLYDESKLVSDTQVVAIQINGKTRAEVVVATSADNATVESAAKDVVADRLKGKTIKRTVVVPHRLVNFVIE